MQKQAAKSLYRLAESCGAADRASVDDIAPQDPNVRGLGGCLRQVAPFRRRYAWPCAAVRSDMLLTLPHTPACSCFRCS